MHIIHHMYIPRQKYSPTHKNKNTHQEDPARETILYEDSDSDSDSDSVPSGPNRRLQSKGGLLQDKHSLSADYEELVRQEQQLQRRVAKLKPRDMLPFRAANLGRCVFMHACMYACMMGVVS